MKHSREKTGANDGKHTESALKAKGTEDRHNLNKHRGMVRYFEIFSR